MCEHGTDFKGDYGRRTFYVRESKWGIPKALREKNLTLAQKAKANFIQQFVAKGEITEVGEKRLEFMETHGIDCQILSYGNNSPSYLDPETGGCSLSDGK
ncbi:MAG: hypothetical protein ACLURP_01515 [Ruminococcus sp.]